MRRSELEWVPSWAGPLSGHPAAESHYLRQAPNDWVRIVLTSFRCRLAAAILVGSLAGCATNEDKPVPTAVVPEVVSEAAPPRLPSDIQKIADLERQLIREQRQYLAEKRRLDLSLKESQKLNEELQKKLDDLQKKLDALLAIDRDLRSRSR
jgi:hypothetical protein